MGLTDKLVSDAMKKQGKDKVSDPNSAIENNIKAGLVKLTMDFKEKVANGEISLDDIKDVKDLVTIAQIINSMGTDDSSTPQIQAGTVNFIKGIVKLPDGETPTDSELANKVGEMSSEDVNKLLGQQEESLNENNSEKF